MASPEQNKNFETQARQPSSEIPAVDAGKFANAAEQIAAMPVLNGYPEVQDAATLKAAEAIHDAAPNQAAQLKADFLRSLADSKVGQSILQKLEITHWLPSSSTSTTSHYG